MKVSNPIYLDHHATTPLDPRVLDEMLTVLKSDFGNASSIDHVYGTKAKQHVDLARERVANLINANHHEIIFTSGATESDNLAILGIALKNREKGNHIVTSQVEHKAVLDVCHYLESIGFDVTYLPVDKYGQVSVADVKNTIRDETILVSIMTANNEVGTINPIQEIADVTEDHQAIFHTDAAQAFGHIPLDVGKMRVDLISFSAHKFYGPKGVGGLFIRDRDPPIQLLSLFHGGGHERGLRSGTLNVSGIVGMGKASIIAHKEMFKEQRRLGNLRSSFYNHLKSTLDDITMNGHPYERLEHNLNLYIKNVKNTALIRLVRKELAISSGSACTTTKVEPSHVLLAMGFSGLYIHSCIRIGFGRFNTEEEVKYSSQLLQEVIVKLRRISSK